MVPGTNGVRAQGSRRQVYYRRCALAKNAGSDEFKNQIPRKLPTICAHCAARACFGIFRSQGRESLHVVGSARGAIVSSGNDCPRAEAVWLAKAANHSLDYS